MVTPTKPPPQTLSLTERAIAAAAERDARIAAEPQLLRERRITDLIYSFSRALSRVLGAEYTPADVRRNLVIHSGDYPDLTSWIGGLKFRYAATESGRRVLLYVPECDVCWPEEPVEICTMAQLGDAIRRHQHCDEVTP